MAARLLYGSLGTDTGGSVRLPAGMCGVVGLKPTYGRVSRHGVMPLSFSLDHVGPLTRTVRDCARMMRVVAGQDERDPTCATEPVPDYEAHLNAGVKGLKIGVPANYFYEKADAEIEAAMEASLEAYRGLGAEVMSIEVPDPREIFELGQVVSRSEVAAIHRKWLATRPQDYSPQAGARSRPYPYPRSLIRKDFVPDYTATVLERLDASGAVDLGALPVRRSRCIL